ncbi:MAG: hypothetical protein GX640_17075 [Fibrobacter sp.]|nr:hypothetical protein [Fibrobacter sp.]
MKTTIEPTVPAQPQFRVTKQLLFTRYFPLILISAMCGFFVYFPVTDSDIWWHLASAREMIAQKSFLTKDPFSFTITSPHWINLHWLFQLMCYGVFTVAGAKGLILLKCSFISIICILSTQFKQKQRFFLLPPLLCAILFFESRYLILIRPVLITLLCMTIFIILFEKYRSTGNKKYLLWLFPVQIIWTNSQGLFAISIGIATSYLIESVVSYFSVKRQQRLQSIPNAPQPLVLLLITIALAAVTVVNPYGIKSFLYPLKLFLRIIPSAHNIYSINISENIPFFEYLKSNSRLGYSTLIATSITFFSFALNAKNLRIAHVLQTLLFAALAFMAERNVLLYFLIVVSVISNNVASYLQNQFQEKALPAKIARYKSAFILIFIFIFSFHIFTLSREISIYPSNSSISPFRFPDKAVDYIKQHNLTGNIFNDIRYGGYLMWRIPGKQVFIDGRLIIRTPQFFAEFLSIYDHPELFSGVAEKFRITTVLLPSAIFYRSIKLARWLYNSPEWDLAFTDGSSVLFTKRGTDNNPPVNLQSQDAVNMLLDLLHNRWHKDKAILTEARYHVTNLIKFLVKDNDSTALSYYQHTVSSPLNNEKSVFCK